MMPISTRQVAAALPLAAALALLPVAALAFVACGGSDDGGNGAVAVDAGTSDVTTASDGAPTSGGDACAGCTEPLDAAGDTGATDTGDAASVNDASDAAPTGDGGFTPGAPITAPADTWTWVDVPASKCGSGTSTGFAVNPHASATQLVIYLEGGGSCTTGDTCWGPDPGATNMSGYDAGTFSAAPQRGYPILDRGKQGNPFAAMDMAYIPYCTGDLHGGAGTANLKTDDGGTVETYFYGGYDMDRFLERLVPTFPSLTRVYLVGTSAGGFGSFINFDRVARDFGLAVYILDDSGPPIPYAGTDGGAHNVSLGVWKYPLPPSCPTCGSLRDLYDNARAQQPSSRYGLLTFNQDAVIAPDFGYTPAQYPQVIASFATSIAGDPSAHIYEVDVTTPAHVVESMPQLAVDYLPWMTELVTDDAAWSSQEISE
jgi:hypothetical protein